MSVHHGRLEGGVWGLVEACCEGCTQMHSPREVGPLCLLSVQSGGGGSRPWLPARQSSPGSSLCCEALTPLWGEGTSRRGNSMCSKNLTHLGSSK